MFPSLDPLLEDFLGGKMPPLRAEGADGFWWRSTPKPSPNNSSEWVAWQADQVDTPTWWLELSMVPRERDVKEFARKVWASFELLKSSSHTQGTSNDYFAPPAPQSLEWDQFFSYSQHHIWQAGVPHEAAKEDLGIHQSPAVLGGESPAATAR